MGWLKRYEDTLKSRYQRLYGEHAGTQWAKNEKKKLHKLSLLLVICMVLVVVNDIHSYRHVYENVRIDPSSGNIVGVERPKTGEGTYSFNTKATILTENGKIVRDYYITIEPAGEIASEKEEQQLPEKSEEEKADQELKQLISNLNADTTQSLVLMPSELENGERVIWSKEENADVTFYLAGTIAMLWILYRSRFYTIKQEEKKARESIIRELPEFINKLVLLLNAGVVLNKAFLQIVEDYRGNSFFYNRMGEIAHLVRETNAAFHEELYRFAKYSGVKELMRITNIILDNISKGDDLADKLRRENELLWFARKQQAEEKGRLAETKLTMPLMVLLLVLIMITIAPAMMEM